MGDICTKGEQWFQSFLQLLKRRLMDQHYERSTLAMVLYQRLRSDITGLWETIRLLSFNLLTLFLYVAARMLSWRKHWKSVWVKMWLWLKLRKINSMRLQRLKRLVTIFWKHFQIQLWAFSNIFVPFKLLIYSYDFKTWFQSLLSHY